MAAIQLNFSLRTSANCKTVHLLGSWDNYSGQLPLSKDSKKTGGWVGTFRFPGASMKQGSRYWYYYIVDGYHVSHDPAREFTVEPTTGRKLNILDIPKAAATAAPAAASKRHSRRTSSGVPKGRALSPSRIQAPTPVKPNQVRQIVAGNYAPATIEALTSRFSAATMDDDSDYDSDDSAPSMTSSRSSTSSRASSVSSTSSCCTCERFGITRAGDRVKLDCGGSRCSFSDDSDECSSEDDEAYEARQTRRQGIVIRS